MCKRKNFVAKLVALCLIIGAMSLVVGCNQPTGKSSSSSSSGGGSTGHHPAEGIVWKQYGLMDGMDWYCYFEAETATTGKLYKCRRKDSTYWSGNTGVVEITAYTRAGDTFTSSDGERILAVGGNIMLENLNVYNFTSYTKATTSHPTPDEVKAGAAITVEP